MKPEIILEEERDFGAKINATFTFIKQEFKPLFTVVVYLVLPLGLIVGTVYGIFNSSLYASMNNSFNTGEDAYTSSTAQFLALFSGLGILTMLLFFVSYVFLFSVVISYLKLYKEGKRNIQPSDVWSEAFKHLPTLFVLFVVNYFLTIAACIALIIPGIYVGVTLTLSSFILVFEGGGLGQAITGSFALIKGKWWSTFGLVIVLGFICSILGMAFSIPNTIYTTGLLFSPENNSTLLASVFGAIYFAGIYLVYVILIVGVGFQYFNLYERKYAGKLHDDIQSIGTNLDD